VVSRKHPTLPYGTDTNSFCLRVRSTVPWPLLPCLPAVGTDPPPLVVFRAGGGVFEPDRRVRVPWGASKSILGCRANLEGDFVFSGVGLEWPNSCSRGRASRHRAKGTGFVTDRLHSTQQHPLWCPGSTQRSRMARARIVFVYGRDWHGSLLPCLPAVGTDPSS
jgi:hypothetical protein